jgi:hypothetical protein
MADREVVIITRIMDNPGKWQIERWAKIADPQTVRWSAPAKALFWSK